MKTILVVDDQVEILRLAEIVLRGEERVVVKARSGPEALELARRIRPDLVLLDLMMPGGMDGYEVARRLREEESTRSAAIILMTARLQDGDRAEALSAGADDYIRKPFEVDELKGMVSRRLQPPPPC